MNAHAKLVCLLETASRLGWHAHTVTASRVHLAHPVTGWRMSVSLRTNRTHCALVEQAITSGARHRAPGTVNVWRVTPVHADLAALMTKAPVSR